VPEAVVVDAADLRVGRRDDDRALAANICQNSRKLVQFGGPSTTRR
jgi:hypothetical protein